MVTIFCIKQLAFSNIDIQSKNSLNNNYYIEAMISNQIISIVAWVLEKRHVSFYILLIYVTRYRVKMNIINIYLYEYI